MPLFPHLMLHPLLPSLPCAISLAALRFFPAIFTNHRALKCMRTFTQTLSLWLLSSSNSLHTQKAKQRAAPSCLISKTKVPKTCKKGIKLRMREMGLRAPLFLLLCIIYLLLASPGSMVLAGGLLLVHELELKEEDAPFVPEIPPSGSPFPLYPSISPSPLSSFVNISTPKLSGECTLNFTSVDSLITTTATDCLATFAPFLANVICCPQLDTTLTILIGQSSLQTGRLALDSIHANHCLSDIQQLLSSRGSEENLKSICAMHLSNLTEGSCPIKDVNSFESVVDSSRVLESCQKVDPVNECCSRVCQNAIEEAAGKIAVRGNGAAGSGASSDTSGKEKVASCRRIVVRWLSSRLEPGPAKQMLRQISNCNVNEVCPLVFPDTGKVAKECGGKIESRSICCKSMDSYVSHLQKQSFITNLQALDCASSLGIKLQKMNVTADVYALCGITLKDFSLQG
ncbi:hypothetical protein LUZ61_016512 [Rhynchospora tenuis]|uniref:SPARK domain-containing protein n=1 Tax=Rhynchospora tenuis TaxID=198213 RepID=A0AAD6EK63_9POAL|nr:hypothetical protein LUZ61_016512 [Rhynchospora tenuis]